MKIFLMEHPRNIGDAFYNDIANTPLSSCLILPSVWGVLEREHEVFFADGFLGKLSYQTIKKDIALFQPQLIAVHMVYQWDNHCELRQFFKEIRELCSASIVVCGFYPSFAYKDLLMTIPEVDGIVIGEPETAFQALSRGVSVDKAPSMAYRDVDGSVRQNPLVVVNELDSLPFPHYTDGLLDLEEVNIEGSRGCYNHCTFCYINDYYGEGRRWRGHSVDYVFDEINAVMEKTGKYRFYFVDPNFFGPGAKGQRRALAMASKLKPLGIRFGIEARVNDIHEDTVAALMEAGLEDLLIGLESGSQRCLDGMKKHTTVAQNEKALKILKHLGLKPNIGFIMFQPDSAPRDIRVNFEFLKRNGLLDDLKISANLLYHNQILLQGSQCYRALTDLPTPKPYHVTLPYEDRAVGQLASFMRELTNLLFRRMSPIWSNPRWEGREPLALYRKINNFLVDTFEEILSHQESFGGYENECFTLLTADKMETLAGLCDDVFAKMKDC